MLNDHLGSIFENSAPVKGLKEKCWRVQRSNSKINTAVNNTVVFNAVGLQKVHGKPALKLNGF